MAEGEACGDFEEPRHYVAPWVDRPVEITGRMDDPLWSLASWSEDFVDILGCDAPKPQFRTRFKVLWSDRCLTIGAEMEEPHVWATHTVHDAVIFEDNDFEIFIDPDGDGHLYGELEVNALNTTWDLLLTRPYHAHGAAITSWELPGLRTAVGVDGTLNDPRDVDRGWTVEISIPWEGLAELARRPLPPDDGDVWRLNSSRVEWNVEIVDNAYRKVPGLPEMNWVWSPQGVVDMHRPHRWGTLEFSRTGIRRFEALPAERRVLADLLEAQSAHRVRFGRWSATGADLDMTLPPGLEIEATSSLLEMRLGGWRIDQHARIWRD